jgi:hypothetical protein
LLFFLIGCAVAPAVSPTATPFVVIEPSASLTTVVTPITSPTKTAAPAVTEVLTPSTSLVVSPTPTIACQTDTASVALSASAMTLKKGEAVTVTATLMNRGCAGLGLPQYRLYVEAEGTEPILNPDKPAPIVHQLVVAPSLSDATTFILRAVSAGRVTLKAFASYEVHLSYPGPAYWGSASSESMVITVTP